MTILPHIYKYRVPTIGASELWFLCEIPERRMKDRILSQVRTRYFRKMCIFAVEPLVIEVQIVLQM